ncbi:FUSC family protein [Catelliglobosispora koreensis]|uniref:FUSC family protein n=1 Tax=Catelliglobosispora koreensis TaxID=129052 RepID=UPI000372C68B|nr:FUSC family protein [Catelliglobosispora koreensis]
MDAGEMAARSRASLKDRVNRVRGALALALQVGVAAGLAWYVSHHLLGHHQPFFAPIAAVVVLAVSVGERMRRAAEIVAGNAVGILLGEALILVIGRGAWQVGLAVLLAVLIAIFAGGSAPLVTQAASSASLVATLIPPQNDYYFSRFVDAVVGGAVGLGVMALLLPLNPLTVVGRAATPMLNSLAEGLADTAIALSKKDQAMADAALDRLRDAEAQLRAYNDAINAGREISTVAPLRWRKKLALAQYVESSDYVARALRNTRVLVRRSLSMLQDGEPIPPSLSAAIQALSEAVTWLRRELGEGTEPLAARAAAVRAVRACAEAYQAGLGFSGSVVVAQIRSTATDLITASGPTPEEANRLVRKSAKAPSIAQPAERPHQIP